MHTTEPALIGSARAAQMLSVDRATFNRWVKAGRLTPALTGARLFDRRDVEALAAELGRVSA